MSANATISGRYLTVNFTAGGDRTTAYELAFYCFTTGRPLVPDSFYDNRDVVIYTLREFGGFEFLLPGAIYTVTAHALNADGFMPSLPSDNMTLPNSLSFHGFFFFLSLSMPFASHTMHFVMH